MYRLKHILTIIFLASSWSNTFAVQDTIPKTSENTFGELSGHLRSFTMSTTHFEGDDYWTSAIGGRLSYVTPTWHGLQIGIEAGVSAPLFKGELSSINGIGKWESELYDKTKPNGSETALIISGLYLNLTLGKIHAQAGRMVLDKGPWLLKCDGRMHPFAQQGVWIDYEWSSNQALYVGWISGIAQRGIPHWTSIDEAIGSNSNGLQPNGEAASYQNHEKIAGMALFGWKGKFGKSTSVHATSLLIHRLTHNYWLEGQQNVGHWIIKAQTALVLPTHDQAEADYESRYMQPDETGMLAGLRVGRKIGNNELTTSFVRVGRQGRFLFPRELGRENSLVSQPRFWLDGLGDSHVYDVRWTGHTTRHSHTWKWVVSVAYLDGPGSDPEFNKYNVPNHMQTRLQIQHNINVKIGEFCMTILGVIKHGIEDPRQSIYYKTGLININAIVDWRF